MSDIHEILRSNYVRRWHAHPELAHLGETNGHHQAAVAQILFALHPDPSPLLIYAALHHDTGEMGLCDISSVGKRSNPELAHLIDEAEKANRERMGCNFVLGELDARWLRFADRLAAYMHVRQMAPDVLESDPAWEEASEWLEAEATALGLDEPAILQ